MDPSKITSKLKAQTLNLTSRVAELDFNFQTNHFCNKKYLGRTVVPSKADERGLFDEYEDKCDENAYDGNQECHCGNGRKISSFKSSYKSSYKDRKYDLTCTAIENYNDVHSGHSW